MTGHLIIGTKFYQEKMSKKKKHFLVSLRQNLGKCTRTKIIFLGQNPISLWAILKGSTVGERLEQSRVWSWFTLFYIFLISCSSTKTAQLNQKFEHLFWDRNVLLIIILQLYDDVMIFQYKTTTLKHKRTWNPTPFPNGLGAHIKVGQETQEGCSKVRKDFMDS